MFWFWKKQNMKVSFFRKKLDKTQRSIFQVVVLSKTCNFLKYCIFVKFWLVTKVKTTKFWNSLNISSCLKIRIIHFMINWTKQIAQIIFLSDNKTPSDQYLSAENYITNLTLAQYPSSLWCLFNCNNCSK